MVHGVCTLPHRDCDKLAAVLVWPGPATRSYAAAWQLLSIEDCANKYLGPQLSSANDCHDVLWFGAVEVQVLDVQ